MDGYSLDLFIERTCCIARVDILYCRSQSWQDIILVGTVCISERIVIYNRHMVRRRHFILPFSFLFKKI